MEILTLPKKASLTFFEVQYFQNEGGGKGKAKHVLLVTYSKHPNLHIAKTDKKAQVRVKFDLSVGREIYRRAKTHLGADVADEIKRGVRGLKKQYDLMSMFGIRCVISKNAHKYTKGKFFYKRKLDPNNSVFATIGDCGSLNTVFSWEGEYISVVVKPHKSTLSDKQSRGVGYYTSASANADLRENMIKKWGPKETISGIDSDEINVLDVDDNVDDLDEYELTSKVQIEGQIPEPKSASIRIPEKKMKTAKTKKPFELEPQDLYDQMIRELSGGVNRYSSDLGTSIRLPQYLEDQSGIEFTRSAN